MGLNQSIKSELHASQAVAKADTLKRRLFWDEYVLGAKLGVGAFGQVRIATAKVDGTEHAVKILDMRKRPTPLTMQKSVEFQLRHQMSLSASPRAMSNLKSNRSTCTGSATVQPSTSSTHDVNVANLDQQRHQNAKSEVGLWRKASEAHCRHCIALKSVFWDQYFCYMVMDRCEMTLWNALRSSQELNELFYGKLFIQMVEAISALHALRIVHRDIKPDNFFVDNGVDIRLGDFGLSARLGVGAPLTEVCGTTPFMSPEMLRDGRHREKTDVWSLGVMMYVLVYGQFPYTPSVNSREAIRQAIKEGVPSPSFKQVEASEATTPPTAGLKKLIASMLTRDPVFRLSSSEVLEHTYWRTLSNPSEAMKSSLSPLLGCAMEAGAFKRPYHSDRDCRHVTDLLLMELCKEHGQTEQIEFEVDGSDGMRRISSMQSTGTGDNSFANAAYPQECAEGKSSCTAGETVSVASSALSPSASLPSMTVSPELVITPKASSPFLAKCPETNPFTPNSSAKKSYSFPQPLARSSPKGASL